jgi:hypothetical protein
MERFAFPAGSCEEIQTNTAPHNNENFDLWNLVFFGIWVLVFGYLGFGFWVLTLKTNYLPSHTARSPRNSQALHTGSFH